jgi:hypothetical protein
MHATSLVIGIGTSQALFLITFNWIKEATAITTSTLHKVWPRVGGRHMALKQYYRATYGSSTVLYELVVSSEHLFLNGQVRPLAGSPSTGTS